MNCRDSSLPTISIITPCYNSTAFVRRLFHSLSDQTYKNFEWILVDDFSKDGTVELLKSLPSPGALGIKLYKLPQNSGGGVATGLGVNKASGDLVVIVDHDDEVVPEGLQAIAESWRLISHDDSLCGLFFGKVDSNGATIGDSLERGTKFSVSWLRHRRPSITDGVFAMKSRIARIYFSPDALEAICLFGVPLIAMTKEYMLLAGGGDGIVVYHRDNPDSQTNAVKVSRKTVFTYARYLDMHDWHYLYKPVFFVKSLIALIKFSTAVHRDPTYHNRYLHSPLVRLLNLLLLPIGVARYAFSRKDPIQNFPPFDLAQLERLEELRGAGLAPS